MPNFESVLENYGVRPVDGIVMEGDTAHYISQNPYYLLPNIESNDVTSGLSSQSRYVLMPLAQGIETLDNIRDSLDIQSILTTSDSAYSKTDLENMQTMEKESSDIDGPFDLGVSITEDVGDDAQTQIVYFASSSILTILLIVMYLEQTMSFYPLLFPGYASLRKITQIRSLSQARVWIHQC